MNFKFQKPFLSSCYSLIFLLSLTITGSLWAQGPQFHLIAGSFADQATADELATALRAKNYQPQILAPAKAGANYRVSIYQSDNRAEIDMFAQRLKQQGARSYWILALDEQAAARTHARMSAGGLSNPDEATYHVIMGSYDDFTTANDAVDAYKAKGFEPYIVFPQNSGGWYRVSVFRSQEKAEVAEYQSLLSKRGKDKGWILEESAASVASGSASTSLAPASLNRDNNARLSSNTSRKTFHLIAGSFNRFDQASEFSAGLRSKGYSPLIIFPETGISETFRVSVYQSTQRVRVDEFKAKFNKGGGSAWVYTQ